MEDCYDVLIFSSFVFSGVQRRNGEDGSRRGRGGRGGRGGKSVLIQSVDQRSNRDKGASERAMRYNRRGQRSDEAQESEEFGESRSEVGSPGCKNKVEEDEGFSENLPVDGEDTEGMGESDEEQPGEESLSSPSSEKKKRGKKARIGADRKLTFIVLALQGLSISL